MHKIKFSIIIFSFIVANTYNAFAMLKPGEKAKLRNEINELYQTLTNRNAAYVVKKSQEIYKETRYSETSLARLAHRLKNKAKERQPKIKVTNRNKARLLVTYYDDVENISIENLSIKNEELNIDAVYVEDVYVEDGVEK